MSSYVGPIAIAVKVHRGSRSANDRVLDFYVTDVHVNHAKDTFRMSGSASDNHEIGHGDEDGALIFSHGPTGNLPNGASNSHQQGQMEGGEAAVKQAHTARGQIWTSAHLKVALKVAHNKCCILEKQINRDKGGAWRIFCNCLRVESPPLFVKSKMDRNHVLRRVLDVLGLHRSNVEVVR